MKARCPKNDDHGLFITSAHVLEEWKVDRDGHFVEMVESLEVVHGPSRDNQWACAICGALAEVK